MIKYARQKMALLVFLVCVSGQAGSALPVIDPAALIKFQTQIVKMVEQINLLNNQVTLMQNQLTAQLGDTAFSGFQSSTVADIHSFLA